MVLHCAGRGGEDVTVSTASGGGVTHTINLFKQTLVRHLSQPYPLLQALHIEL